MQKGLYRVMWHLILWWIAKTFWSNKGLLVIVRNTGPQGLNGLSRIINFLMIAFIAVPCCFKPIRYGLVNP